MKISLPVILVIAISVLPFSSASHAEGVEISGSMIELIPGEGPPPITRDPFINAPLVHKEKPADKNRSKSDKNNEENKNSSIRSKNITNIIRDHKVTGVILNWDNPVALLNHRIVAIGDRIDEFTITFIDRKGVLLSDGERVIQLPLE